VDQSQQEFQRATRIAAAASMGSMLLISAFAAGTSHAAANGATPSSLPVASTGTVSPTVSVASEAVVQRVASSLPTAAPACANTYVVRPGDFWLRLAEEASVDVAVLYRANGANPATVLQSGQQICLPDGVQLVATAATPTTHAASPVTVAKKPTVKHVSSTPVTAPVTTAHTTRSSK
jgi:LysM repeat protein